MIEPFPWQQGGLRRFLTLPQKTCLVEACPGAGKTIFSGLCMQALLTDDICTFAVIVVPTTAIKGDRDAGFLGDWHKVGIHLTTELRAGVGRPREYGAGTMTYHQLQTMLPTLETWATQGQRLFFVFDEIHHATESNIWGQCVEACNDIATRILCMTGTPFRGDGRRISLLQYDESDVVIPDIKYTYREAVSDRVCREVLFAHDDGTAEFILDGERSEVRISKSQQDNEGAVAATIFRKDSPWLTAVIEKAQASLEAYRLSDPDAGGIVICRPGTDEGDDKYLRQVASLVHRITGEAPVVVTHDDKIANEKIEKFRASSHKWICAVRKISEGVDIKRLRVMVMATKPSTELLFRQLVGRVVRVDEPKKRQDAIVYMAQFPELKEWADAIEAEARAGLVDAKDRRPRTSGEERDGYANDFVPISSTHEDGGAVSSYGEQFSALEISHAESLQRGDDQLIDLPLATIAHILRKNGGATPNEGTEPPRHQQKKDLRGEIDKLAKRVAYTMNPQQPDFQRVWVTIHRHMGSKNIKDLVDNHSIEEMLGVRELLIEMLAELTNGA